MYMDMYMYLAYGISLSLGLLQPARVPHLQLLDGNQECLVRRRDLCPELGTDALGEACGAQTCNHLSDVFFSPSAVEFSVF